MVLQNPFYIEPLFLYIALRPLSFSFIDTPPPRNSLILFKEIQKEKIASYKLLKQMNKEELEAENDMKQNLNESEIRQQRLRIKKRVRS